MSSEHGIWEDPDEAEARQSDSASGVSRRDFLRRSAAVGASIAISGGLVARGSAARADSVSAGRSARSRAEAPKRGGTITASNAGSPTGYDIKWWNDTGEYLAHPVSERLIQIDPFTGKYVPTLATAEPMVTKGGTLYTYKLRRGVQFHKGFGEMTSEDVKWSWERLLSPQLNAEGGSLYTVLPIVGLESYRDERAKHVKGIRAVDRYTVAVELEGPDSAVVPVFTYWLAAIFSKKGYEQLGPKQWNWTPVATGPFELQKVNPATGATLVRHSKYWRRNLPYVDSVTVAYNVDPQLALLRIENNEQDMMFENVPPSSINQLLHDPRFKGRIFQGPGTNPTFLSLPTKIEPVGDVRVRKAIAMAIDKVKMARILKGSAVPSTGGFLPPTSPYYQPTLSYRYAPQAAKQLLSSAGQGSGYKIDLLTQNTSPWSEMAQSIQGDLAQIGVTVNVKPMEPGQFATATVKLGDRLPMIIWDWGLPYPHASAVFDSAFTSAALKSGCCNYPRFAAAKLDTLIKKAHTVPLKESISVYKQAERTVVRDDVLWVPLVYLRATQLIAERIAGYRMPLYINGSRKLFQNYWIT